MSYGNEQQHFCARRSLMQCQCIGIVEPKDGMDSSWQTALAGIQKRKRRLSERFHRTRRVGREEFGARDCLWDKTYLHSSALYQNPYSARKSHHRTFRRERVDAHRRAQARQALLCYGKSSGLHGSHQSALGEIHRQESKENKLILCLGNKTFPRQMPKMTYEPDKRSG